MSSRYRFRLCSILVHDTERCKIRTPHPFIPEESGTRRVSDHMTIRCHLVRLAAFWGKNLFDHEYQQQKKQQLFSSLPLSLFPRLLLWIFTSFPNFLPYCQEGDLSRPFWGFRLSNDAEEHPKKPLMITTQLPKRYY